MSQCTCSNERETRRWSTSPQSVKRLFQVVAKTVPKLLKPRTPAYYAERKKFAEQYENFNFLEKVPIYCICLEEHEDRYKHCVEEFKRVGILQWVQFYRPKRDPEGGIAGCWRSHDAVIRMAYESKAPYALILEDDVIFSDKWRRAAPYIKHFLDAEPDWHYLRLGCMFVHSYDDDVSKACPKKIWRVASLATQAYFISRPMMEAWTQRAKFQGRGVDHDMLLATTKDYALKHSIAWQSSKFQSSIVWGTPGTSHEIVQKIIHGVFDYEAWQKTHNKSFSFLTLLPKQIRPTWHLLESDKTFRIAKSNKPALLL